MTLAVLKLVHERCVGHASAEALVLQLASICLRDRNTFDFRSNRHPRNIHRNSTFSWTSWSVSQPARVEVQDVRLDGVHLVEYSAGTTIVGSITGQLQWIVGFINSTTWGCTQETMAVQASGMDVLVP